MSRYVATETEQAAIDLLTLAGYAVVRQRTYDQLRERVRYAEQLRAWESERREHTSKWAHDALDEQRRLADRLNRVVASAASLGVSITDINAALDGSVTS